MCAEFPLRRAIGTSYAEGEGFEPSRVLPPNGLANRPLRPLG